MVLQKIEETGTEYEYHVPKHMSKIVLEKSLIESTKSLSELLWTQHPLRKTPSFVKHISHLNPLNTLMT